MACRASVVAGLLTIQPDHLRRALDASANGDAPLDDVAIVLLGAPVTDVRPLSLRAGPPRRGTRALLLGAGQKRVPAKPVGAAATYESLHKARPTVISDATCRAFHRRVSCLATGSNAGGFETSRPSAAVRIAG